ncbi:hypothetical protein ACXR0O_19105 [Verrucomicrobiota bacterium sgz303538]
MMKRAIVLFAGIMTVIASVSPGYAASDEPLSTDAYVIVSGKARGFDNIGLQGVLWKSGLTLKGVLKQLGCSPFGTPEKLVIVRGDERIPVRLRGKNPENPVLNQNDFIQADDE